jgi:hypothetical protein
MTAEFRDGSNAHRHDKIGDSDGGETDLIREA